MTKILNLNAYYGKLARKHPLTEDEVIHLLKMAAHFQAATVYLAEGLVSVAERLPKSASKSARNQHASLCRTAAKAIQGESSGIALPPRLEFAIARCRRVADALNAPMRTADGVARSGESLNNSECDAPKSAP